MLFSPLVPRLYIPFEDIKVFLICHAASLQDQQSSSISA
jgi:hypothetical protein